MSSDPEKGNPMKTQTLEEDAVAATAATVADWRAKLAEIEEQIAAEKDAIAIAKQERERHTFAAQLADTRAIVAVEEAKAKQSEAEQRLADLVNQRWPAAWQSLAEAERLATNARREARRPHAEAQKRQCVIIGARIDKRYAENTADFELLQRIKLELQADDTGDSAMVSRGEAFVGLSRHYAALPAYIRSLPANPTAKFIPLAVSEAQFLGVPPVETTTTKAA
jgi:hypothetical protein